LWRDRTAAAARGIGVRRHSALTIKEIVALVRLGGE
jgi:hypothetical protein